MLRAAVRGVAAEPKLRLKSFSGMERICGGKPLSKSAAEIQADIFEKLKDPPRAPTAKSGGMRGLFEGGESADVADIVFRDFVQHELNDQQIDAAFRALLRITAYQMLLDDIHNAKYGWTHCMTLPQAALGLASIHMERKLALATSLCWCACYRSVEGKAAMDFTYNPEPVAIGLHEALHSGHDVAAARFWDSSDEEIPEMVRLLATEASIRNDQHHAKYTRACFEMCGFDPQYKRLYLAAAARLAGLWVTEVPREKITEKMMAVRPTP
jgi:hypothetical protein